MEKTELLDLIPLYVTGKLSDDQKIAIENELPRSRELQAELAFWRSAETAAKNAAAIIAEGHLSSEQIVDYARGELPNPKDSIEIQQHLQECASCRRDYEMVEPAFAGKAIRAPLQPIFERFSRALQNILRPSYTVSALAILILCVILFKDRFLGPEEYSRSFALQFQSQDRSGNSSEIPTLTLDTRVDRIHVAVPIPHATLQPMHYSLSLSSPDSKGIPLVESLAWAQGSSNFDTAKVTVPKSALPEAGTYTLLATISYTPTSQPFEYSYRFNVEITR